ncbi:hypothetical protein COBT_001688 [Conglomerata obtusa]
MLFTNFSIISYFLVNIKPQTGPVSIVTNYDFDSIVNLQALAFVTWNNFFLAILHNTVLKNLYNTDEAYGIMTPTLHKLFTPEEDIAINNIYEFIDKNDADLKNIKFNQYGFNCFVNRFDHQQNHFWKLSTIYFNFIKCNQTIINNNKSLMNLYVICYYRFKILDSRFLSKDSVTQFNYHQVNKLDINDFQKILSDEVAIKGTLNYSLGIFILPVFDNKIEKNDNAKQIFETLKLLVDFIEKLKQINMSKGNIDRIHYVNLKQDMFESLFVESNYNIPMQSHIYNTLESCFWLMKGFNSFLYLGSYVDVNAYFDLEKYQIGAFQECKTSCNCKANTNKKLKLSSNAMHSVYVFSNFYNDETKNKDFNQVFNLQNKLLVSLLKYTILKLASGIFEFNTNEKILDHLLNELNINSSILDQNSKMANININEDIKDEHKKLAALETINLCEEGVGDYFYDKKRNDSGICLSKPLYEINNSCMNQKEFQEDNVQESDKFTDHKIINACLKIYREISLIFNNMEVDNFENVFSIFQFVENVINSLKNNELITENIIEEFYLNFINKKLKINLFNTESIKIDDKNKQNPLFEQSSKNVIYLLEFYVKDLENDDVIEQIDLKKKIIKIIKKDLEKTELKCDNNYAIFTILIMHGLEAVLTSIASYKTTTEFYNHLVDTCFKLNLKKNVHTDKNFLREDNTRVNYKNYNTSIFYKCVEQQIQSEEFDGSKPAIFYYDFYIYYNINTKYLSTVHHSNYFPELAYISGFNDTFLEKERGMEKCNVFVLNIFYVQYDTLQEVINIGDKSDNGTRFVNKHNYIVEILKNYQESFPRCFIVKHQNMELTMDTLCLDGKPLSFYYKPIAI